MRLRKTKKYTKYTLNEWIKEKGVQEVAELLDVQTSTVNHWKRGYCLPRVGQMKQIKKLTKGRVSYEAMIEEAGRGAR